MVTGKAKDKKRTIAKNAEVENVDFLQHTKHPLEHTWNFWLYTNKSKDWESNQVKLTTFDTVEDYWCLYHNMKTPSELKLGQDYAIFKDGISPMWEDPSNKLGGRWLITRLQSSELDRIWLDTVLLVIGENFENSDMICGVVANIRQESKICVWTRKKDPQENMKIGKKLKQQLGFHREIKFLLHNSNSYLYRI